MCPAVAGLPPSPRMGTHQQVGEKLIFAYVTGLRYTALKAAPCEGTWGTNARSENGAEGDSAPRPLNK